VFMLFFIFINVVLKREFGSMLIDERNIVVYDRKDRSNGTTEGDKKNENANAAKDGTPAKIWNFVTPILLLIFFIFYLLVKSGEDGTDVIKPVATGDTVIPISTRSAPNPTNE